MDAASGADLYEQNADKYFVPASNMKLFTTALALGQAGTGIPVSHDDGSDWQNRSGGWKTSRADLSGGAGRSESFQSKISVRDEGRV